MSRVLLVGVGLPGYVAGSRHHGPGFRTEQFARGLAADGTELLVLAVLGQGETAPRDEVVVPFETVFASERALARGELDARIAAFAPDCVVGAGAYASSLAAGLAREVPMWADVFGDLMAEAQSKALATGDDWALVHFWNLLRTVLSRADRFSAVSGPQASALVGQLGLAGRLSAATAGEALVHVLPCAAPMTVASPVRGLRGELVPADAFVVLWSGGFNTWCDVDLLFGGLELALEREPRLHFVATGGAIPGHDERTNAEALARCRRSRDRDRLHLLDWIPSEAVAGLTAEADVGIVVERALYERELGSENRVVRWAAAGLPTVTTARSPLGRALVADAAAFEIAPPTPEALASVLVAAAADPDDVRRRGERAQRWARENASIEGTTEALVAWCRAPRRAADARQPRLIEIGLLSSPDSAVEFLEAYLSRLSLAQVSYRSLRWLARRLVGGAGSLLGRGGRSLRRRASGRALFVERRESEADV
jgi:glycosyltransferase involved in cell wall biosynthesis